MAGGHGSRTCSWGPTSFRRIRKLFVDRLFFPTTALRFRHIFRELHARDSSGSRRAFGLWLGYLVFTAMMAGSTRLYRYIPYDILLFLNDLVVKYAIARVEGLMRRKWIVLDEGFVTGGMGIWMRMSDEEKKRMWDLYNATEPWNANCVVLDCGKNNALLRAKSRSGPERPILGFMNHIQNASSDPTWVSRQFEEMSQLLHDMTRSDNVLLVRITSDLSPADAAEILSLELSTLTNGREPVWWAQ